MATYKPYKKTESGKEEIKIPYSVLSNPPNLSVYAKLAGGNTFSGNQVITGYLDIRGTAAEKHLKTRGIGGSDGNGNSSDLYLQYSSDYKTYFGKTAQSSLNADGSISINGKTAATTDQIPAAANNGTLTIQKNGTTVQTFTANQSSSVIANITVPTKASDVNALSLDGGTINKSKTIKMDASANSDGANLKWGTVNSKNPYIGYASDQTDGTFVVGSLLGTNYASGLAIGGGSGNLLWKGTKVATTSDIPNVSGKANLSGGNTFTGNQQFNNGQYWFNGTLGIEDKYTNSFMTLDNNGFNLDVDGLGGVPFMIEGDAGTSGQVLTSQGAGNTPQWTTPAKGTVTQVKVNGTTKSPNAAGLVDLGTIGGGGSTAWSSGTSGSVKLPSAGLYVVVSDNFTFVVYWNGSSPAYSNSTYRSRNNQWVQTEIAYNGVLSVYAYSLNPYSKTLQNETIKYRKIGEA